MIDRLRHLIRSFSRSREGAVAVLAALLLTPLILAAGMATDYSREAMLKASLQSIADDAALAGASTLNLSSSNANAISIATSYFNKGVATIANSASVGAPTVAVPNSTTVIVTASAALKTTLLGMFQTSMPVNVTAVAQGPGYAIKVTFGGFKSGAADANTIYYYLVGANGLPPLNVSAYTELFTNNPADPMFYTNSVPKTIVAGPDQRIGFAMLNQTGAVTPDGTNAYGGTQNSYHYFFSSAPVVSNYAGLGYANQGNYYYNGVGTSASCSGKKQITTTNISNVPTTPPFVANEGNLNTCPARPCVTVSGTGVYQNNLTINGACSTQANAAPTCLQLYDTPETYAWNDMGGFGYDDYNYKDANFTVNCVPSNLASSSGPAQVILTQ